MLLYWSEFISVVMIISELQVLKIYNLKIFLLCYTMHETAYVILKIWLKKAINIIRVEQMPVHAPSLQLIELHSKILFAWAYLEKINKTLIELKTEQMSSMWTYYFTWSFNQHVFNSSRRCLSQWK